MISLRTPNRRVSGILVLGGLFAGVMATAAPLLAQDHADIIWKHRYQARRTVTGLAISPDSTLMAKGISGRLRFLLVRMSNGGLVHSMHTTSSCVQLGFSPDNSMIANGQSDQRISLWRVSDGTLIRVIPSLSPYFAFSPDGQLLASPDSSGHVNFWRVSDGVQVASWDTRQIAQVAYSPDGKLLAGASSSGQAMVWRVSDGALLYARPVGPTISDLVFSPDGATLASAVANGTVNLIKAEDGSLLRTLTLNPSFLSIDFAPDSEILLVGGSPRPQLSLWRVADGVRVYAYEPRDQVRIARFAPNGEVFGYGTLYRGTFAVARSPFSGQCHPNAVLIVVCRLDGAEVVARLRKAHKNSAVTFTLDEGEQIEATTDDRGRASVTFTDQEKEQHAVTVCHLEGGC